MPEFENLIYETRNQVAYLTLNRPERLNALSAELRDDLDGAFLAAEEDLDVQVVVIKAAGRAFCAGYDLQAGTRRYRDTSGGRDLHDMIYNLRRSGERWMRLIWNFPKPVIAQVHGYCLAGGNDLAGTCDIIVCGENAQFGFPQSRALGIAHTFGLYPLTIGMRRTKHMAFTGDTISGREAERIGMVNECVPDDELDARVTALAERYALMPRQLLSANKQCVNRWFEIMGVQAMVATADEFDAIGAWNPRSEEFARIARDQGLKAAIMWRDAPWKDYESGKGRVPSA